MTGDEAELRRLEESLWRPESRLDREYVDSILAQDCVEFGRSGRCYTREDMLDISTDEFSAELPLPGFAVRLPTQDVALVTYRSEVRFGEDLMAANRCSVWRRGPDGWLLEFHQGTPVEPRRNPTT